jgi:hypothetical protein
MDQQLCKALSAPLWLNNTYAHLTTEVLNLDRTAFESHHEAALELVLCSVEFLWGHWTMQQKCELMYKMRKDRRSCRRRE